MHQTTQIANNPLAIPLIDSRRSAADQEDDLQDATKAPKVDSRKPPIAMDKNQIHETKELPREENPRAIYGELNLRSARNHEQ